MKKLILGMAAAAAVMIAVPASAQVTIRGGDDGVRVRIGDDDRWERRHVRDRWHHRRHFARDCRVIKTRKHLPNGKVIIKTREVCD